MTKITFDLEELQEFIEDLVYVSYDTTDKGYNDHFHYRLLDNGKIEVNYEGYISTWELYEELEGKITNL